MDLMKASETTLQIMAPPPPATSPPPQETQTLQPIGHESEPPLASVSLPEPPLTAEHVTVTTEVPHPLATALEIEEIEDIENKNTPSSLSSSVREESNYLISDLLSPSELKSLNDLKTLVQEALENGILNSHDQETSIWGVPLLKDSRTDVILLKFLRARDFKSHDSFTMLENCLKWRRDFNVDELVDEDLGGDLDKVMFMHGHDKEGHPVWYDVFGEFQNEGMYGRMFGDEEKRLSFLRRRIQFMERSIRALDFSPRGVNTIFHISDFKNAPGLGKRKHRMVMKQALHILQDNYPDLIAKQVFINLPWGYLALCTMISPFLPHRTKNKSEFTGPKKIAATLFKYILPEQVPTHLRSLY